MFNAPHFQDHDEARKYLKALRWAGEPVCAHCGTVGGHYASKKPGVWRCHSKGCRKDFSVTTKTVMESSHIKLNIWLQAYALMTASKKGISPAAIISGVISISSSVAGPPAALPCRGDI